MVDTENLLKELLETFRLEAQDHLGAVTTLLLSLENEGAAAERQRLVETIFRRMHTLKGAAHAVNLVEVAASCQELEDLLADLKRGERSLELGLFDRLHADLDALSRSIFSPGEYLPTDAAANTAIPPSPGGGGRGRGKSLGSDAEAAPAAGVEPAAPPSPPPVSPEKAAAEAVRSREERRSELDRRSAGETVRVPTRILEALLVQAEELVSAKLTASALMESVAALSTELAGQACERTRALELSGEARKRPQQEAQVSRLASFSEQRCQVGLQASQRLRSLELAAAKHQRTLRAMVDPLLEDIKKLHLLPFSTLTDPFGKLVRDLGRELDKSAELSCQGTEIEIDRRILAELREPLLHLLRNVMDHGLEQGPERRRAGKPERGRIALEVRLQDANRAELVVTDDGRGIDLSKVKGAALRQEILTPEAAERLSDSEALQLIFESGLSTSPLVTTLSGRGVGLAIVRESLERLGGHVTVASRPGEGTEFRLSLPLTYAMLRGLLVETAGRACIIPAANVELTARVEGAEIRSVENRETVLVGGEVVSLVRLAPLLELPSPAGAVQGPQPVVLVSAAERRLALAVDQVVGVQEFLVKPLGSQLSRVRNVAGATVLGDGRVVPILNLGDLFRSALLWAASGGAQPAPPARSRRLSVLVVEDSITSRTLMKNILSASGYSVKTAVDGADALTLLKSEEFDLVVSDVEMPRLDGFALTAAIRADQRLAALPVVLVTGLESRSDRERGIEAGANAYVVKSSFDQGGLLDVIEKLT